MEKSMTESLGPCKCGTLPKIRTRKVDINYSCFTRTEQKFWAECPDCFYTDGNLYDTKAEAIEAWNRRVE